MNDQTHQTKQESEMRIKPRDDRPRSKFWAPGDYCSRCTDCGEYFTGDKRAITCADCAYKETDQ